MHHLPRPPRGRNAPPETPAGRLRRNLPALPLALALLACCGDATLAAIYRWTDQAGTIHFADSLHGVPPQYRDQMRTLNDRLPPPPPPRQIPLEYGDLGYLVKARINGSLTARLVLDTGASGTVLSPGVARRLGLKVRMQPPVLLQTANGTVEAGWAEVDDIEVGGRRAGPLTVVVHEAVPGADGLLGMNFLGAFRVEIRASDPSLVLSPP